MQLKTANTIAAEVANIWNKSRSEDISAAAGFEVVLNNAAPFSCVAGVRLHHLEITYTDGSILTVLNTDKAKEAGMTDFAYAYKAQDQLC